MPVILTDHTNKIWCTEQPNDGYLHVGWLGRPGPRLIDVLEFLESKGDQFSKFIEKKRKDEMGNKSARRKRNSSETLNPQLTEG